MAEATLEARVERLEEAFEEQDSEVAEVWRAIGQLVKLQTVSQQEMREFREEMLEFKNEMREFKDEMREFKDKVDRQIAEMNRQWGNLANKMGTLVEDIVAPGLPYAIKSTFGMKVEDIMERRTKKLSDGRCREYDVIAVADGKVFVVEVKSSLDVEDVDKAKEAFEEFFTFFPEFKGKKLVGVVSSLNVKESVVNHATNMGLLVLTMGGEYLQFENADKVEI